MIAHPVLRIQCPGGHWMSARLILTPDLTTHIVAPGQRCPTCSREVDTMPAIASPFATFAPERVPATLDEVGVWFAYMADHSAVPHPDDPADSIAWSTPDLVELFADPERRIRYDRAMAAAFAICEVEGIDIYYLGLGDCECGHPMSGHQTGTGPWSGFCGDTECKCEEPVMA